MVQGILVNLLQSKIPITSSYFPTTKKDTENLLSFFIFWRKYIP